MEAIRYTRDGAFQRSRNGTLITAQGEPVLNAAAKADRDAKRTDLDRRRRGDLGRRSGSGHDRRVYLSTERAADPEGVNRYIADPAKATASSQERRCIRDRSKARTRM